FVMKRPPWGRSCMMPNYDIAELCHGCLKLPILRAALRSSGVSFPLPASGPADSLQGEANAVSRPPALLRGRNIGKHLTTREELCAEFGANRPDCRRSPCCRLNVKELMAGPS